MGVSTILDLGQKPSVFRDATHVFQEAVPVVLDLERLSFA